jgi:trans-2,3-dihydro-3-hydroxyanthranilate isomerase
MALPYLQYDVFTGEPLSGNQLAVFTDARGIDTSMMQLIAREMNFAESTFILPAERTDTDIRMRIFTPQVEMPMAGHPTIGSTFALAHHGVIKADTSRFTFGLNIGPIPVDLEWTDGRLRFAWMTQARPEFGDVVGDCDAVAAALGLTRDDLADFPSQQVSCGLRYLIVPLRDHNVVDRAVSDAAAFRRLRGVLGLELPIYLFSLFPARSPETVYARMFAPELGVVEDPATGSAAGPLGCYLVRHGLVEGAAAREIVCQQGVAMGRASRIHVSIEGTRDAITQVKVGGEAVLVGKGELFV